MTQLFTVPFPFLQPSDIHVCEIDPETRKKSTEYQIIEWVDGTVTRVKPQNVPPSGRSLMIYRETPRDAPLVDFSNGQILTAEDLDEAVLQNLYICEELIDELEWYGNEVDLLWDSLAQLQTAYNTLRADHTVLDNRETQHYNTLTQAIATLRASLETTIAICQDYATQACDCATQACISKRQVHNWFCNWYNKFMPAIQNFMYLAIVDGGTPQIFSSTEEVQIIDGSIFNETDISKACIYDGRTPDNSTWWSWTEEALKLMTAHEYACTVYRMLNEIECFRSRATRCDELFNVLNSGRSGQVFTRTSTGWTWKTLDSDGTDPEPDPEEPETNTLTIYYEFDDGREGSVVVLNVAVGDSYNVYTPHEIGYTASTNRITGVMGDEPLEFTVTYTATTYNLTISYVYADGTTAAPTYTGEYAYGETYEVESPVIDGCTTSIPIVSGMMIARDLQLTVVYTATPQPPSPPPEPITPEPITPEPTPSYTGE